MNDIRGSDGKLRERDKQPNGDDLETLGDVDAAAAALFNLGFEEASRDTSSDAHGTPRSLRGRWKFRWAFVVPAKAAAVAGLVVAIVALASLVLVANAEGADGLSTIALSLAILAFVVQILVFIAQAQATSQQMLQSEQINTQSRVLLTEVQTTARSTELLVRDQFHDLLKAFVDAAPGEGGKVDLEGFERRLMEGFETRLTAREGTSGRGGSPVAPPVRSAAERMLGDQRRRRLERVRELRVFPPQDKGEPALEKLKALTPEQRDRLQKFAEDEMQTVGVIGIALEDRPSPADRRLLEDGLIAKAQVRKDEETVLVGRLTEDGRVAVRLLTGLGEIPEWAARDLPLGPLP